MPRDARPRNMPEPVVAGATARPSGGPLQNGRQAPAKNRAPRRPPQRPFDARLARLPSVRLSVAASVGLGLVSTAGIVAQAVGLAHLLAGAMPGAHGAERARWFVLLGAGFAARALAALAGEVVASLGASAAKADLRSRLVTAVLHPASGSGGRETTAPSEIALLAGRGLDALDVYIGRCLPDLVLAVAAPVALLVAVGAFDWVSLLVMASVLALFPLFGALVGQASWALGAERWRRVEELGNYLADVFQGMPVLRAFGRSAAQRERVAELNKALGRSSTKALRLAFLSALVLDTLGSLSVALVAVPLGLRLLSGGVSLASALAVLAVAPEVFAPLRKASAEFHESTEGLAAVARVMAIIDDRPAPSPAPARPGTSQHEGPSRAASPGWCQASRAACTARAAPPDLRRATIGLRSVSVFLPGRPAPVLDQADLAIRPGETVALVGPSGSGKTTVVSLLAGFTVASRGKVFAGEDDLYSLDLRWWRSHVTYLPEHPTLVSTTLAGNLRLANPGATDEQLLSALEEAGAAGLAASLPGGLEARLGEGGRVLSAGEAQRVALARVMLRPALLYLLDEPTVHLDGATEEAALAGLRRAVGGARALIVSHRPAIAQAADRVVTLRDGKLVEISPLGLAEAVPA